VTHVSYHELHHESRFFIEISLETTRDFVSIFVRKDSQERFPRKVPHIKVYGINRHWVPNGVERSSQQAIFFLIPLEKEGVCTIFLLPRIANGVRKV
jgi:hypothetical protein